jgi:hypothetical protein
MNYFMQNKPNQTHSAFAVLNFALKKINLLQNRGEGGNLADDGGMKARSDCC